MAGARPPCQLDTSGPNAERAFCSIGRGDQGQFGDHRQRGEQCHCRISPGGRLSLIDQRSSERSRYGRVMEASPRVLWMPGGVRTEVHLGAGDTNDAFCLLVDQPPAGWSLPAHLHHGISETIHVVEGEFDMTVDGNFSRLAPGETIHVPADVVHSGGNIGETTGRRIVIFSPAGMERFFVEVGTATPEADIDPREALASAVRHGWEFST
jgi:quercetin dioxygenase-like cupin family protein